MRYPTKIDLECGAVMLEKVAKQEEEIKIATFYDEGDHVFGYQVLLDFYGCKAEDCDDLELCYDFLDKIVGYIGMNKMGPPQVMHGDVDKYPEKGPGVSGWIPLIESSVVIHTLSTKGFISIDVYSCKYFEPQKALEFAKKYFKPERIEYQTAERGINYYNIDTQTHSVIKQNGEVKVLEK